VPAQPVDATLYPQVARAIAKDESTSVVADAGRLPKIAGIEVEKPWEAVAKFVVMACSSLMRTAPKLPSDADRIFRSSTPT
jgi:hypothetical protein